MKACPICGARAFDDAEVCYGCLHRYGEEPARPAPAPAPPADARCPALRPEPTASGQPKSIPIAPPLDGAGWVVRFELPGYAPVVEQDGREGGFTVRFRPEEAARPDSRDRIQRGTHARDAPGAGRALATAAGRL